MREAELEACAVEAAKQMAVLKTKEAPDTLDTAHVDNLSSMPLEVAATSGRWRARTEAIGRRQEESMLKQRLRLTKLTAASGPKSSLRRKPAAGGGVAGS